MLCSQLYICRLCLVQEDRLQPHLPELRSTIHCSWFEQGDVLCPLFTWLFKAKVPNCWLEYQGEEVIFPIILRHGRRLWNLRVIQAEIKLNLRLVHSAKFSRLRIQLLLIGLNPMERIFQCVSLSPIHLASTLRCMCIKKSKIHEQARSLYLG